MANVVLRVGSAATNGKAAELIVDGHDITDHVLASGFEIAPLGNLWAVTLTLAVGALEADLPDAIVQAVA